MCAAADRLRLWKPVSANSNPNTQFPEDERERVKDLLANAWQESTRASYATGLVTDRPRCRSTKSDQSDQSYAQGRAKRLLVRGVERR
jgi:hypothetical protein